MNTSVHAKGGSCPKLCARTQRACGASQTSEKTGPGFSEHVTVRKHNVFQIVRRCFLTFFFSRFYSCVLGDSVLRKTSETKRKKKHVLNFQSTSPSRFYTLLDVFSPFLHLLTRFYSFVLGSSMPAALRRPQKKHVLDFQSMSQTKSIINLFLIVP